MKPMSDSVFLDTNILVYSYSSNEIEKQIIARKLITENNTFISTQVLQELTNIITRKFKFSYIDAQVAMKESCQNNYLHTNSYKTILDACRIAQQNGFSFYDSLIISAAIGCSCGILYSEDMNNGQIIDNKIKIINPFS